MSREVVIIALAVVGVQLALALGALALHAVWDWAREHRHRAGRAAARAALVGALLDDAQRAAAVVALRPLARGERVRLLCELAVGVSGEQQLRIGALAHALGVTERAERRCHSRLWWRRLNGARLLTLLGGGARHVPALLRDRHALVRAQAAEWVAEQPSAAAVERLVEMLGDERGLARFTAHESLLRIGAPAVAPLSAFLSAAGPRGLEPALTTAVGLAEPRLLGPTLVHVDDPAPPVRALVAAALGAIGGAPALTALERLLADPEPRVRAAAARALASSGDWRLAPALVRPLGDADWGVRRAAALGLRTLGSSGEVMLRRAARGGDGLGAEMARFALDVPEPLPISRLASA